MVDGTGIYSLYAGNLLIHGMFWMLEWLMQPLNDKKYNINTIQMYMYHSNMKFETSLAIWIYFILGRYMCNYCLCITVER